MRISNLERKEEEEVLLQNKDIYGSCDTARALFALIVWMALSVLLVVFANIGCHTTYIQTSCLNP